MPFEVIKEVQVVSEVLIEIEVIKEIQVEVIKEVQVEVIKEAFRNFNMIK